MPPFCDVFSPDAAPLYVTDDGDAVLDGSITAMPPFDARSAERQRATAMPLPR
jgi:hypothetical protein